MHAYNIHERSISRSPSLGPGGISRKKPPFSGLLEVNRTKGKPRIRETIKRGLILLGFLAGLLACTSEQRLSILNVHLVDVESGLVLENSYIEIVNGVISAIGPMDERPASDDPVFDGQGRYVTPGLSDMLVYVGPKMADTSYWTVHPGDRMIAAGVTTIRDGGFSGPPEFIREKEALLRGEMTVGPDIVRSVRANYSSGKDIKNLESDWERGQGAYVKTTSYVSPAALDNILRYTGEAGIYSCTQLYSFGDFQRSAAMGLDELATVPSITPLLMETGYAEGINWFEPEEWWKSLDSYFRPYFQDVPAGLPGELEGPLQAILAIMEERQMALTSGIGADRISAMKIREPERYQRYAVDYRLPEFVDSLVIMSGRVYGDHFRLEAVPEYVVFQYELGRQLLAALNDAGLLPAAGTGFSHRSWYGLAPGACLHDELMILQECGFSRLETLQAATLIPSLIGEAMGLSYRWGRIKPGYTADLVFTEGNPLDDLQLLREPATVVKAGIVYSGDLLRSLR